ncbi:ATP-binding cassette domain-containing protein [Methylorubrum sp. SB2]|uniref:ATP-binding cassette domain-containing protein n=1 Tax=Methylorubrum subtropicum TaxID=3138812 RepID=UPI00313A83EB
MAAAVLAVITATFALLVPNFLSVGNLQLLATDFAEPGLVALALFLVVLAGGIDLSLGAIFALANLAALLLFRVYGFSLGLTVPAVIALGAGLGAVNGVLVAVAGLRPFLTTMAMLLVLRGVYDLVSQKFTFALASAAHDGAVWQFLGGGQILGVPVNLLVLGAVALGLHAMLTRTRLGMHVIATGSDPRAARQSGVRVERVRFWVYPAAGAIVAGAAILYAARQDAAGSNVGSGWEVAALTALVMGGASLTGGRGGVVNVLVGAASLSLLSGGLLRLNAPGNAASAVIGASLLLAVGAGIGFARRREGRRAAAVTDAAPGGTVPEAMVPKATLPEATVPESAGAPGGGLHLRGIGKSYAGTVALDGIDLAFAYGEIHALVGQNGAGKSTLSGIVAGETRPDAGTIALDGRPLAFATPADANAAGIAMVYQESSLVPDLTVAQNLQLGAEPFLLDRAGARAEARAAMAAWGWRIDPRTRAGDLDTAARQVVEIARAVRRRARLIVFDEPTAALTPPERATFFRLIRHLRAQGSAVVLVTHALEEVLAQADTVTVLRDGRRVATGPVAGVTRADLVRMMVGRTVPDEAAPRREKTPADRDGAPPALAVVRVRAGAAVRDMSFEVKAGEVVGLTGLVGAGRTETARHAVGLYAPRRGGGAIRLHGRPVAFSGAGPAVRAGLVYVTEDRKTEGLFESLSVEENIVLGILATRPGRRFLYPRQSMRARMARPWLDALRVTAIDAGGPLGTFSGGNQQKVVLARALAQAPDVILADEPTRGVDVGAIPEIHAALRRAAGEGKAVLAISSDLSEVLSLSDRIVVARAGRVVAAFDAAEAREEAIVSAAMT